jgi:two-component system chemotaxis response regulator CheY
MDRPVAQNLRLFGVIMAEDRASRPSLGRNAARLRLAPRKPSSPENELAHGYGAKRPLTILVVDDDLEVVRLVSYALRDAGHDTIPALSGLDALSRLSETQPDLIITDLEMPDMTGIEFIDEIRQDPVSKDVPILAMTTFLWDRLARSAAEVGCNATIAKPFGRVRLLERIEALLASSEAA